MRAVVADTGPLNYLVLIGQAELFSALFETVLVPEAIRAELTNPKAPLLVRQWIASAPPWLNAQEQDIRTQDAGLRGLDEGERQAILLAQSVRADLILMDDRAGVAAARARGFTVFGTMGLLNLAARRSLLDLKDAIERLRMTNFDVRLDAPLAQHKGRRP